MSKIHILQQNSKKDTARVVYHIVVPDIDNSAGFSYRDAIVEYLKSNIDGIGITSQVPNLETIDSIEFADIQSGAVFEKTDSVNFDANLSDGQKAVIIDNHYNARKTEILLTIQDLLKYWGMTRNPE